MTHASTAAKVRAQKEAQTTVGPFTAPETETKWTVQMRGGWAHEVEALTKEEAMAGADRTMRLIDDPSRAYDATPKAARDIPTLTPITASPVDLNLAAWGEDASGEDDDPRPSR